MSAAHGLVLLLAALRLVTLLSLLPPFASRPTPAAVKIGLGVALALVWMTAGETSYDVHALNSTGRTTAGCAWLAVREVLIGAASAWVLGLLFVPFRVAGTYLGQELGLSLGELASPLDQQPSSAMTTLLEALAMLALFGTNAHHGLLRAAHRTLDLFPVAGGGPMPDAGWITRCVAGAERAGLELIGPLGVGMFVVLGGLLLLMRLAPQFNYQSVGGPLRLAAGLLLLAALWPDLATRIQQLLGRMASL